MGVFASPDEINESLSWNSTNPLDVNDPEAYPGFLDESWAGLHRGIGSGVLTFSNAVNRITPDDLRLDHAPFNTELGQQAADAMSDTQEESRQRMLDYDQSGITTMGTLGRIIKGGAKVLTEAGMSASLGIPAPIGVGAAEGLGAYDAMKSQGIDDETALKMGGLSGATNAAFVMMPGSIGLKSLVPDLLTSVGLNDAVGMIHRSASSAVLENAGYVDMAKQYQAFDAEQMVTDTLLAGVFHGVARRADYAQTPQGHAAVDAWNGFVDQLPTLPWRHVDAALTVNEARHADTGTAPGIPATPGALAAHINAMEEIDRAIAEGRTPNFEDTGLYDAAFVRDPAKDAAHAEIGNAIKEEMPVEFMIDPNHEEPTQGRVAQPEGQIVDDSEPQRPAKETEAASISPEPGNKAKVEAADAERSQTEMPTDRMLDPVAGKSKTERLGQESLLPSTDELIKDGSASQGEAVSKPIQLPSDDHQTLDVGSTDHQTTSHQPEKSVEVKPLEIQAAERAVAENPNLAIGTGEGETALARDILAQHDADIAHAKELANLIEIAATCALRT